VSFLDLALAFEFLLVWERVPVLLLRCFLAVRVFHIWEDLVFDGLEFQHKTTRNLGRNFNGK